MRKLLVLLVVCPLAAFAQGDGPGPGPGAGAGPGPGNGRGVGPEQAEKRLKLTRVLGLAEALDLDAAQALELGKTLEKYDARRLAAHRQLQDARQKLHAIARGEKATPADVDAAVQRIFEARTQLLATDREMVAAVAKDLPAEKRARAALFLGRFEERIEKRVFRMRGRGPGPGGPGMGPGGGMGMGPERETRAFVFRGPPGDRPADSLELCMDEECPGLEEQP